MLKNVENSNQTIMKNPTVFIILLLLDYKIWNINKYNEYEII